MNPQPLNAFWASSQDPTKVSTTISGAIIAASVYIIAFASALFHVQLTAMDVTQLATGLGYVAAAIVFLVGIAHKLIQKFGKAKQ